MQLLMVETNSSFFPLKSVQEVQRNTQTLDQHFVVRTTVLFRCLDIDELIVFNTSCRFLRF